MTELVPMKKSGDNPRTEKEIEVGEPNTSDTSTEQRAKPPLPFPKKFKMKKMEEFLKSSSGC